MIGIGSNIYALKAQRTLNGASRMLSSAQEQLSSGTRLNRPSDDAAGLSIAESLRADTRVYTQAMRNIGDGVSTLTIADSALAELGTITTRIKELSEQSANGVYTAKQRQALNAESRALTDEFNRILSVTKFNGRALFDSNSSSVLLQSGYGIEATTNIRVGTALERDLASGGLQDFSAMELSSDLFLQRAFFEDFSGDGIKDFLGGSAAGSRLTLGTGVGALAGGPSYVTSYNPASIGDLNEDGQLDYIGLIAGGTVANIEVNLNTGGGNFSASILTTGSSFVANGIGTIGDINGDDNLDIVVGGHSGTVTLYAFLGNGDGTFQTATNLVTGVATPRPIESRDLDGDGSVEILSGGRLFGWNGSNLVELADYSADVGISARFADINGDGSYDIIGEQGGGVLGMKLNQGALSFGAATTLSTGIGGASFEYDDLDGDNFDDIVAVTSSGLSTFLGDGAGGFSLTATRTGFSSLTRAEIADFDQNGVNDIFVWSHNPSDNDGVYLGAYGRSMQIQYVNLLTAEDSRTALDTMTTLSQKITTERSRIGAYLSRLEAVHQNLQSAKLEFSSAESRIRDADIAQESSTVIRAQIIQQAGVQVLQSASLQPQLALKLLNG
jgi:flagellin